MQSKEILHIIRIDLELEESHSGPLSLLNSNTHRKFRQTAVVPPPKPTAEGGSAPRAGSHSLIFQTSVDWVSPGHTFMLAHRDSTKQRCEYAPN